MKQIKTFWNWFQNNEEAIKNALLLGINTEEVLIQLEKKFKSISKKIGFLIDDSISNQGKYTIIFTAAGHRKLFSKLIALEKEAPSLKYFTPQAFIKSFTDTTPYKNGTDLPFIYKTCEIKISELQLALLDYDSDTKQLKILVYLPNYHDIIDNEDLEANIDFIIMQIIGEIAFRKHIKQILLAPLLQSSSGLLSLIELPDYIDYLYKINSRKITREV